jgi:hypothetical protein
VVRYFSASREQLKDSGELDQITTTWMSDYTQAPVISAG